MKIRLPEIVLRRGRKRESDGRGAKSNPGIL
jgi:hypothetical protein